MAVEIWKTLLAEGQVKKDCTIPSYTTVVQTLRTGREAKNQPHYKTDKSTQTESIQTEQSTQTDQMDRVGHPIVMPNTSLLM